MLPWYPRKVEEEAPSTCLDPDLSSAINWEQNRQGSSVSLMHVCESSTLPQKYSQVLPWLSWPELCMEEGWKLKEAGQFRRDEAEALCCPQFCRGLHRGWELTGDLHTEKRYQ